jgi:hypothetical protein
MPWISDSAHGLRFTHARACIWQKEMGRHRGLCMNDKEDFFIGAHTRTGPTATYRGVALSFDKDDLFTDLGEPPTDQPPGHTREGFHAIVEDYVSELDGMHASIPLVMSLLPSFRSHIADIQIFERAKMLGKALPKSGAIEIFQVDEKFLSQFNDAFRHLAAIDAFERSMPGIFLIGLVAIYDGFLARLVRGMYLCQPEILSASNRTLTFSQISNIGSLDAARDLLIQKEVESILRSSHSEHFEWLEKQLSIPLRKDLSVWPSFIEACERRNLWTHNGGVVSQQYLDVCRQHRVNLVQCRLGEKLHISPGYYRRALNVFYEIGVKLAQVVWRKLIKAEMEEADHALNDVGFNLIKQNRYRLAQALLEFGCELPRHSSDVYRRMMVVNLANAHKLSGDVDKATRLLDEEDWSAVDDNFRLCVAAVKGDIDEAIEIMRQIGGGGKVTKEAYQSWPVLIGLRKTDKFREAYKEIFGEPFEPERQKVDLIEPVNTIVPAASGVKL